MVIKASSRAQVEALLADLGSDQTVARESAITCLTVIGGRALERLMGLAEDRSAPSTARVAAFRVLEAIANPRSLDLILRTIDDADTVIAAAAAGASRVFLRGVRGAAVVDRLTEAALATERAEPVRVAALGSLSELGPATLKPLYDRLSSDANPAIAALASPRSPSPWGMKNAEWLQSVVEGDLPDDPAAIRGTVLRAGKAAPLQLLHRLVERLAERERTATAERRVEWTMARGAVHAVLAGRGSRLALYDLRETFETTREPLPLEFISALREIGDAQSLEPIAVAYARAKDEWWRDQLTEAFDALVSREHLTKRHAVVKRIERRWPAILAEHQARRGAKT